MLGKSLSLKGELRAVEDVTIDGRVEGNIVCEGHAVVLGADADVTGDVLARDITVFGRLTGRLTASEVVDVRAGAVVAGSVVSKRFILDADAAFNGRVEPQRLEAALSVAKFRDRQHG
jgi:cytoskeletal protein CcmA (bactofilin family)